MSDSKAKHVYIHDLHYEHKLWRNELSFYKDELEILENRLQEVLDRNSNNAVEAESESFQNRFDLQRDHISGLKHRIKRHERYLADYAATHPVAIDHVYFIDHTKLREDMDTFRVLYQELKTNFNKFAVNWM